MALESEYFPAQASRLSSLPPDDRSAYKSMLWCLFGVYAAAVVIMGVVVVGNVSFQKADVIVVTGTLPPQ